MTTEAVRGQDEFGLVGSGNAAGEYVECGWDRPKYVVGLGSAEIVSLPRICSHVEVLYTGGTAGLKVSLVEDDSSRVARARIVAHVKTVDPNTGLVVVGKV